MPTVELGKLKQGVEPASLAGASVMLETGAQPKFTLVSQTGSQVLTAEVLAKLEGHGVIDWVPGGKEAAAGGPLPSISQGVSATTVSPMLDPATPPEFSFPEPHKSTLPPVFWTVLTYAVALAVVPAAVFFLYATVSESVLSFGDALASFGAVGWVLSLLAGAGVGYGVDALARHGN